MNSMAQWDADLLARYNRPGPRYTSYPTAPQFNLGFGEEQLRAEAISSNEDPIPRRLSLYAHIPYCTSPCFYCGCNRVITRDKARGEIYLRRLMREMSLIAPLFDADREVIQIHLGGGTPNFLVPDQLAVLMQGFATHFTFSQSPRRDFSIELDPRFISPSEVRELAAMGFNRASLGVQDFDPAVQVAVNRIQGVEPTLAIIEACRSSGMRSINVDLIYGLPGQSLAGFERTLDTLLQVRPDRLAIYGYAHLPDLFRGQRPIDADKLPSPELKIALLQLAISKLSAAGYCYIGMDHFALPDDDLALAQSNGGLQRNFMGYTTHAQTDLIGLGVSSISRIGDCYSQNPRELAAWEEEVDSCRIPVWRGLRLNTDDRLREDVIQQLMCQGEINVAQIERRHGIDFADYFQAALEALNALQADGLVTVEPGFIRATPRGRLLLRVISMCFDAYLNSDSSAPARFSKTI